MARGTSTWRGRRPQAGTDTRGTGIGRACVCRLPEQAASGSPRTSAQDERTQAVGWGPSTTEVPEHVASRGGEGGQATSQGECDPAPPALDAEPGRGQARGAGAPTSGGETETAGAAHVALSPHRPGGPAAGGVCCAPATGCSGSRRGDVAAIRTRPGRPSPGRLATAGTGSVPGDGRAAGLHPEARRPPETVRGARTGRHACPVWDRLDRFGHLGGRVPGVFVWMPTRAESPSRPGCLDGGHPSATRARDTRRGHPRLVRPRVAGVGGPMWRAADWGHARHPPHPAMADGGCAGSGGGTPREEGVPQGGGCTPPTILHTLAHVFFRGWDRQGVERS
jgi:hypothetical protein